MATICKPYYCGLCKTNDYTQQYYHFVIKGFLVAPECAPRSVHLCLCVGAVIVCTSLAGDPGQQGGEG